MSGFKKMLTLFAVGAALYSAIEILWRGMTHWSMSLTGGVCLCGIYYINENTVCKSDAKRCFFCSALITAIEFIVGVIFNLCLGMGVWDYSRIRFNLFGQICLLYSFFWFILSYPALKLCNFIRENFFS